MSMSHRVRKHRHHLDHQSDHRTEKSQPLHLHPIQATLPAPVANVTSVWLVARHPPLSEHKILYRWLARWLYERIHWTPDYGIEYQGVYTDEAEARWAASGAGMFVMEVPLNGSLPEETCQYGKHDFPLSEASPMYRNRNLSFVAVSRERMAQLESKVEEVFRSASA